ncbi:MAG: glycoside hydrolase family 25 protein [Eubacteriales bacterium]|nr:glycoside hydrolase family 25 protein [Eubacteriales bacterium]
MKHGCRWRAGLLVCLILTGCASVQENTAQEKVQETLTESVLNEMPATERDWENSIVAETEELAAEENILHFVDVFGQEYEVWIEPDIEMHEYDLNAFRWEENRMTYVGDEDFTYRQGLDVCHHHETIDWKKVKEAGFDFVFIRLGYRGYGQEGVIRLDREFEENIKNAGEEGFDIGVYFYAQAVNEEEAREEAEFVLENLEGHELQLPVVYDPENVLDAEARTDDVTGEQFTKNAVVFCEMIKAAGYQPAIYCNMLWQAYKLDLAQFSEYPIWYADYEPQPQTPYRFEFWQYTNTATVDGIEGPVDLDIQLIRKNTETDGGEHHENGKN